MGVPCENMVVAGDSSILRHDVGSVMNQLMRYGIVGLLSNGAAYVSYLVISALGDNPILAMTAVYLVAATIGFFGNRRLTFNHQGGLLGAAGRYVIAHSVGYAFNLALLVVFVDVLGYPHALVQAAAILIVAVYLFLAFRFFVFKPIPAPSMADKSGES